MKLLLFIFSLICLISCYRKPNNLVGFKDIDRIVAGHYPEIDVSQIITEKDSSSYNYFRLFFYRRTFLIDRKYLHKYTTLKDSVGAYRLYIKDNIDILVFRKYGHKTKMIFLLYDNNFFKELDKIEICFWDIDSQGIIFNNKDARFVAEEGCIYVETFDPVYHNKKITKSEKKNIKITKYCIINKKWVKQEE